MCRMTPKYTLVVQCRAWGPICLVRSDPEIHRWLRRIQSRRETLLYGTSFRRVWKLFMTCVLWIPMPLYTYRCNLISSSRWYRRKINGIIWIPASISASIYHLLLSLLSDSWGQRLMPPSSRFRSASYPSRVKLIQVLAYMYMVRFPLLLCGQVTVVLWSCRFPQSVSLCSVHNLKMELI